MPALQGSELLRLGAADRAAHGLAFCQPRLALWGTALYQLGAMRDAGKPALPALKGILAYFNISRNEQELPGKEFKAAKSSTQMIFRNCRIHGLLKCKLAKGRDSVYFM